jgi:beta-lactamase class A
LPEPTAKSRSRRATAIVAALATATSLTTSCAAPSAPAANAGRQIVLNTPQGVRAQQVLDMLNSDWPIGTNSVTTLATPDMVEPITASLDSLWWDRPYTLTGVDIGAGSARLHLVSSFGAQQDVGLRTDDQTMVSRLVVNTHKPVINSWADVDETLRRTGARYSWQVSKVADGTCAKVAGTNTADSLPLASIFKTYVLYAVEDAVRAGTLSWDDLLTITAEAKKLGSSGFDNLAPGTQITVRQAAGKMIATSDNMATDLLIARVGTRAVERALVNAGHHDPASMTPFPTMRQIFSVGWGNPDVREQWKSASPADRAALLREANTRPYQPDPERTRSPGSAYGAEWYGSAEDICRVHARQQ